MAHTLHYLLMATHAIFQKRVLAELRDSGLTTGQPKVLDHLHNHDGDSQKNIARGCHIEPGSLTTLLKGMEAKALIARRNLNGNRKTSHIFMTDKGRAMNARTQDAFRTMEAQAWRGISAEEQAQFMATFAKIYDNLTERGADIDKQ